MVEKITITPQEVRGLGDIISPKTLTDFNKQYSTLTTTTDTVHGVTTTIYDLDSTILFSDKGTTNNKNTNWQNYSNRLTIETDTEGTTVTKGSSNGFYYVKNGDQTFTNYIAEFDIISCANVFWYANGTSTQNIINLGTYFGSGGHCKIVSEEGVAKAYKDGTQVGNDITITATAPYGLGFRINAGDGTRNIKYKNFRVHRL